MEKEIRELKEQLNEMILSESNSCDPIELVNIASRAIGMLEVISKNMHDMVKLAGMAGNYPGDWDQKV